MITDPHQAEAILQQGQADIVLLAREMLGDPFCPRTVAKALGIDVNGITPEQCMRARIRLATLLGSDRLQGSPEIARSRHGSRSV